MNFEFSDEQQELRNQARHFFADRCPPAAVRRVLDGEAPYDRTLWGGMAEMGFLGIVVPEKYGGLGLGYLELCVVAEEIGRAVAPVPFSSAVYLATELLLQAGSDEQKSRWLPGLATGEAIGTFALAETAGAVTPGTIESTIRDGRFYGLKPCVADGSIADFAIVAGQGNAGLSLALVELGASAVNRTIVETIDPSRDHSRLEFSGAPAELLGQPGQAWELIRNTFDRAAILMAFEQIGGADTTIAMGRDYAIERMAFGRQIGSFQAIKHMLANMFVAATLARSNAYYGAWALSSGAAELPQAAATARVSATRAYQQCALNNIQVHGGMGFTWELDCHLHYRRSNLLALALGGPSEWEGKLIDRLEAVAA
jgi:acyl-CoA dehydrogenase